MIEFKVTRTSLELHRYKCRRCGRCGVWLEDRDTAVANEKIHAEHEHAEERAEVTS